MSYSLPISAHSMPTAGPRRERRVHARNRLVYRERRAHTAFRRIRDVVLASVALLGLFPILALAALAIYCEDRGPIVFSQQRVGRCERLFTMYKLRTMRVSADREGISPTSSSDRRITRVGKVLRKTSIDELPQLINVIRGEMSLVGPRPEMPFIVRRYARWQHARHVVTPGLTGLWQIRYRSTIPLERLEATAVDLEYIHRASPAYDIKMIVDTAWVLLRPKGAY